MNGTVRPSRHVTSLLPRFKLHLQRILFSSDLSFSVKLKIQYEYDELGKLQFPLPFLRKNLEYFPSRFAHPIKSDRVCANVPATGATNVSIRHPSAVNSCATLCTVFVANTGNLYKIVPRLRECCMQVEAEVVSNSWNKIHQT